LVDVAHAKLFNCFLGPRKLNLEISDPHIVSWASPMYNQICVLKVSESEPPNSSSSFSSLEASVGFYLRSRRRKTRAVHPGQSGGPWRIWMHKAAGLWYVRERAPDQFIFSHLALFGVSCFIQFCPSRLRSIPSMDAGSYVARHQNKYCRCC
jgi:hypothetical protein